MKRHFSAVLTLSAFVMMLSTAEAQFGGGGQGGGGGGGGIQIPMGAGVVVDADGVLSVRRWDNRLMAKRIQAARASLDPKLARPSKLRKVSLNRLEAEIAKRMKNRMGVSDEMKYLAGLTQITHVFFYPETNDIVIAGPAEGFALDPSGRPLGVFTGRCTLELQDLIAALRSFPPNGQKAQFIGCSIDPTQEGLARMQQFLGSLRGIRPSDAGRIAQGLRQSVGLQEVTINGISPKTHFAQVLVEADYRMKLIGIGLEKAPCKIPSYVSKANPRDVARNALLRWYFTPNYECVKVSEDMLAMELVGDGIKLVGADELVQANGQRVQSRASDRASRAFVHAFTKEYPELARRSPVFAQLRNMINLTIAAAYIQERDYYGKSGWNMDVFGDEEQLPIENYETPKRVQSAVNVVWKGLTLMTPIGGGVQIQPTKALQSSSLLSDKDGKLKETHSKIEIKSIAPGRWWWD